MSTDSQTDNPTTETTGSWSERWLDMKHPASRFRLIALIEAITWGLLIIGMIVKRAGGIGSATMVPGTLHGIAFVAFVAIVFRAAGELEWNRKVTALALLSSIPPFCSLLFEWWAQREGLLHEPAAAPEADESEDGHERLSV
ncbi:DUF3817 domain-containing protein [Gordonia phosphorivorans]|uniref:DUF3817 domain-containing protein n=1 Tax=Gordonia phosphorivorans TaxID=1056982 RepID=A0ABV6HAH1_9ACTN